MFTATAVLTLALCIGANTAIFTVVDRVLLRPLPFPDPERLASVVTRIDGRGGSEDEIGQTGAMWEALRDGAPSVDLAAATGGFGSTGVNMVAHGEPEYVQQQRVSAGYFRVLGIAPAVGREFTVDEDRPNGPAVAILSDGLWRRAFGASGDVIGRTVTLRGEPYTIVGVTPASFRGSAPVDVWTPARPWRRGEGGGQNYEIIGRLAPGVSWARADGEIAAAALPVLRDLYRNPVGMSIRQRLVPLQQSETMTVRAPLMILWGAVGAVLLIGCVNIAGLLIARGALRSGELATRIALGASRGAIVRQLFAESIVLAVSGGALGLAIGYVTSQTFGSILSDAVGVQNTVGLDLRIVLLTGATALATSVAFGLLPAIQATRVDVRAALVESGAKGIAGAASRWPRRALVVAEVALGVMLLVGAGLLIRTLEHLTSLESGVDSTNVVTATLSLQDARYSTTDRINRLFADTIARLHEIAGVERAAICLTLPYERALNLGGSITGGKNGPVPVPLFSLTYVTPEYFDALRIPIKRGRALTDADSAAGAPVIVVNEAFARRQGGADLLGRQIVAGGVARTIVGVAGDIQQAAGFGNFGPVSTMAATYVSAAQVDAALFKMVHVWFSPSWIVRARGPKSAIAAEMQRAVARVDPQLPFAKFRTLDDVRDQAVATQRGQAVLFGALAALALLLAALGIHGLVASSVVERTRELGIRMALGATPARTMKDAMLPTIVLASVGVIAGVGLARAAARVMARLVWGVSIGDPITFGVAAATVAVVALLATLAPAVRLLRMNPVDALFRTL